uniref:Ubiquitin carboxyl-terminal hydrolase n=1 Tax=Schistosoma japonicum TaxID=6182 RepID=C1LFN0_SCHJA|nr:Ubiquitin carboxyl-terminal hydrolase 2 [Schistosoma japonicum]
MDDLGKRPDFKLSVQGSTFRNYGTPSKYMSVNRLPKHTDSPSLYYKSTTSPGSKSSSSLWNSSTSSLTGNVSDRLNNVSTRFSKLELNENPEPNKKLCNGYYTDYCSIENIQSEVQRESSEIGKSINSRIYTRWSNSSPIHTTASSLVGSHLSYHRGGLVGLNNLGNTCFMNSILQCLSNTAPLTEYCLEDRYLKDINKSSSMNGMLFRSYADLMKEIWDPDMANSSTSPSRFKSQIQRFAPRFMGYSQQDSQEFLRYVLEGLHMEVNRVQKRPIPTKPDYEAEDRLPDNEKANLYWRRYLSMDNSEIVDLFVGQLMSTLECADCSFKSTTFDPFWDLSLPIPKKPNVNILDCLNLFTSKEELDGDERAICSRCKTRRRCTKSFSIQKFPQILVLHLKRFSGERFRSKMSVMVDYPLRNLDLIEFATSSCTQKSAQYKLYAVSNHSGSVYTGHYTASCLNPYTGDWHSFNDSHVHLISENSAISSEGYVLFYTLQQ